MAGKTRMASQADDLQRMLEAKMDAFLKSQEFKDTLTASIREAIGDVIQAAVAPLKEAMDKFDERVKRKTLPQKSHLWKRR